jgi:hypothetical protein
VEPPRLSRSVLVVSHHLDGFLHTRVPSMLQPGAGPGVRWVSPRPRRGLRRGFGRFRAPHQRDTLRRFPSPVAVPHHWGLLPSCRSFPTEVGFAPRRRCQRVAAPTVRRPPRGLRPVARAGRRGFRGTTLDRTPRE